MLEGVEQPVAPLFAAEIPAGADPRTGEITVGDLLSMRAGLEPTSGPNYGRWAVSANPVRYALSRPFVAEPGGRMLYSTGSSHLLSAALTRQSGRSTLDLAREWLGEPLGVSVPPWSQDPQGVYYGGNEMALSPLALLRFGETYRMGGRYGGAQVVPEGLVGAARAKGLRLRLVDRGGPRAPGLLRVGLRRADAVRRARAGADGGDAVGPDDAEHGGRPPRGPARAAR